MTLLPLATALLLGFQHALEADHMVAVTTFVAGRPSAPGAVRFGFRWGFGHSLAVLAFGGLLLVTGLRWPARYDALGEALVGIMLVGLGLWAIRTARKLHVHLPAEHGDHLHLHAHPAPAPAHQHGHDPHHPHQHDAAHAARHAPAAVEAGPHLHTHGHGITLVGLMHGLAGSTAVVALIPVTMIGRLDVGLAYLAVFGVGVTLAMMLYASIAAYAVRQAADRSVLLGRRLSQAVGLAGILVGAWWVWGAARG
jgi:ABC-type nickel/cobalt efflux system permease component RcnA